jgi:hypothetical protein
MLATNTPSNQTVIRYPALFPNHNQTVARPRPVGGLATNHNQTTVRALFRWSNHNQTVVRR